MSTQLQRKRNNMKIIIVENCETCPFFPKLGCHCQKGIRIFTNSINDDINKIHKDCPLEYIPEFCNCLEPDREPGFSYCYKCNSYVSNKRMEEILKNQKD